ncbi:MAG: hypothetical protein WA323_20520 [Candidatus Nitrosopolaris sp.]
MEEPVTIRGGSCAERKINKSGDYSCCYMLTKSLSIQWFLVLKIGLAYSTGKYTSYLAGCQPNSKLYYKVTSLKFFGGRN